MVFRNNSSKGIFGEIMSDSEKLKLSGDSRWLQKVALIMSLTENTENVLFSS